MVAEEKLKVVLPFFDQQFMELFNGGHDIFFLIRNNNHAGKDLEKPNKAKL